MADAPAEVKQPPPTQTAPLVPPTEIKQPPEPSKVQVATPSALTKLKEQNPGLDLDALISSLAQASAQQAQEAAKEAIRPFEERERKWRTAATLGLNEAQADQVAAVMGKYEGMTDKEALALARVQKPDLFPTPPQNAQRPVFGGMPVGGDSLARSTPEQPDFMSKMKAAAAKVAEGQLQFQPEATHWAREEFLRRARESFNNRPRV